MQTIDDYLSHLPQWQQDHLSLFRKLVHEVAPTVKEDWKWNVPVFILSGKTQFAMSAFKTHTKYNFLFNGALLDDENSLFNNGFESKRSRGIDLKAQDTIDETKLKRLIAQSIDYAMK